MTSTKEKIGSNETSVTGTHSYVGGLIGFNQATRGMTSIRRSSASLNISATHAGGLIGFNDVRHGRVIIDDSLARGTVRGKEHVGGLSDRIYADEGGAATVTDSRASGQVFGKNYVGGLLGSSTSNGSTVSIHECWCDKEVSGEKYVGLMVGQHSAENRGVSLIGNNKAGVGLKGMPPGGYRPPEK